MNNILVIAALLGLAFAAFTNASWPWLAAVIAIAAVSYAARKARISTRVQLIFTAGLGVGLGAEIVRTFYVSATDATGSISMYRQVLIVSLISVIIVLAAMIAEQLMRKLTASGKKSG